MTEQGPESAAQRPDDETAVGPSAAPEEAAADAPAPAAASPNATEPPPGIEPPLVPWGPPPSQRTLPVATTPEGFTVGAILRDAFARYAADPIRLVVLGLLPAVASLLGVALAGPQPTTLAGFGSYFSTTVTWSLLAGALSLAVNAITFAVLEVGHTGDLRGAIRWGLGRVGWLFATTILYALSIIGVLLAFFVSIAVLSAAIGGLTVLVGLVAVLVVLWISIRLSLALVATVVDRLDAGQSIRISWAITRPSGVWWRVFGSAIAIGLLVGPISILASSLSLMSSVPAPVATLIGALLLAFISPLSASVQYSAYRRLVGPPAATGAVAPRSTQAPAFDNAGRAFVGVSIVLAVIGLVALPLAMSTLFSRQLDLQGLTFPGNVPAGTVVFGTSANLRTCTVQGQITQAAAYSPVVYMGHFDRTPTIADEIKLQILHDGTEIANEVETRGSFQCLGIETPETDIGPGTYEIRMLVSGRLSASGTLVVH